MAKGFEIRLFNRPFLSVGSPEVRSNAVNKIIKERWLDGIFGENSKTGKRVTVDSAQQISAVWACIQLLSNTAAVVPLNVLKRVENGREIFHEHPTYRILHTRPNHMMSSFTWRRSTMMQVAANGNSYTLIERDGFSAKVTALRLISKPNDVTPFIYNDRVWYQVKDVKDPIASENMLHFKWNTSDGLIGQSPISIAKENIGQALAMQDYGSKIYSEGGAKRLAIKTPAKMTTDQKDSYRKTYKDKYAGIDNLHELMFLEGEGADLIQVGMNPDDAQFVDTMKFKIEEIARIYGVPPHLIQHLEKSTNNNIEHQSMDFVTHTMMPHLVNFEQELDYKLFENEPDVYTKHNVNGLLRADAKTRAIWYRAMADLGVFTINDMLKFEDMNPTTDGDERHIQVNRMPLKKMNDLSDQSLERMLATAISKRSNGKTDLIETILKND